MARNHVARSGEELWTLHRKGKTEAGSLPPRNRQATGDQRQGGNAGSQTTQAASVEAIVQGQVGQELKKAQQPTRQGGMAGEARGNARLPGKVYLLTSSSFSLAFLSP